MSDPRAKITPQTQTRKEKQMADYSPDLATELQKTIASLKNEIQILQSIASNYKTKIDKTKYILKSLVEMKEIDNDEAIIELNQILDLELERVVTYELHTVVQVTVELPYGEEPSEYDFDVTEVTYNGDTLDIISSEISHCELLD